MSLTGSLTGFWILALIMTLPIINVGAKKKTDIFGAPIIPFPPAMPTPNNINDICHSGHARPRYLPSFFPRSGVSHYRRRGNAINRLESWFSYCCDGQGAEENAQTVCCAKQAWELALSKFCVEEYATKAVAYSCCRQKGEPRWLCFDGVQSKADYSPTSDSTAPPPVEEPGFTFNASFC